MDAKSAPTKPAASKSWRDILPIHPAAELFPLMQPDELRVLAEDIHLHGLHVPCCLIEDEDGRVALIDGRNRLDALELIGEKITESVIANSKIFERFDAEYVDAVERVISLNIHRRHLTAEKKRDIIAKLIKATPEKSDRQIADTVKASPTTVGTVRASMEAKGEVSKLDTRTDAKGVKQPARKLSKAKKRTPGDDIIDEMVFGEAAKLAADKPPPRDDIGATSAGEIARKDAELEDLRNAKRQLEINVAELESEIQETHHKRIEQLIVERHKWADAPLPPLNLARLPLGDPISILIGGLAN